AVSRPGEISVMNEHGRERGRDKVPYGTTITVTDGASVLPGEIDATWERHPHPAGTEGGGKVHYDDVVDGVTVTQQIDEFTGLSSVAVLDPKQRGSSGRDLRPMLKLVDDSGKEVCFANTDIPAVYALPTGAIVSMSDGAEVQVGDVIARIPQES